MTRSPLRIALIGAGLIGRRHAAFIAETARADLAAIVDPSPEAQDLAASLGVAHHASLADMSSGDADAAIIATPNADHCATALSCAERGWPCLVEKPIADTSKAARRMIDGFEAKGLPLLIGHHRRYHAFVERTAALIADGAIGTPVTVSAVWALRKPDDYFTQGLWRLGPDGGPVMINLIHEIDLMRHLFGEIADVAGLRANARRGGPVEDTAAVTLAFESGLLASIALTDTAHTPWSFEAGCGENRGIAESGQHAWRICGTAGALELPSLRLWCAKKGQAADWSGSLAEETIDTIPTVPLAAQLDHFIDLAEGRSTTPRVSGEDALRSLEAARRVLALPLAGQTIASSLAGRIRHATA